MKFFASKRIQRVTNFGLALMLVVSTISASVPFLFAQNANAVPNDTITAESSCVNGKAVVTVKGANVNAFTLWAQGRAAGEVSAVQEVAPGTNNVQLPVATNQSSIPTGLAYGDVWLTADTSGAPAFVYDATYNAINCNDYSTVYVSTTGNNTNDGTSAAPFASIQKALDTVANNGTVYVADGVYTGTAWIKKSGTKLVGQSGNRDAVEIHALPNASGQGGIYSEGLNDITVKNLAVVGTPTFTNGGLIKLGNGTNGLIDNVVVKSRDVVVPGAARTNTTGININSFANISINNTYVAGFGKDGISFVGKQNGGVTTQNVSISNTSVAGSGYSGIAFYTKDASITGVTFANVRVQYGDRGIYVDGNANTQTVTGVNGGTLNLANTVIKDNVNEYINNEQTADINALGVVFDHQARASWNDVAAADLTPAELTNIQTNRIKDATGKNPSGLSYGTVYLQAPAVPVLTSLVTTLNAAQPTKNVAWTHPGTNVNHFEYREYINLEAAIADDAYYTPSVASANRTKEVGGSWGTHTLYYAVVAVDNIGNRSPRSEVGKIIIDRESPVIAQSADANTVVGGTKTFTINQNEANPSTIYVEYMQKDNLGVWRKKQGQEFANTNTASLVVDTEEWDNGLHQIKVTSKDVTGNQSGYSFTVTVDNTDPQITVKSGANFTVGSNGVYSKVSFAVSDNDKIVGYQINQLPVQSLTPNANSDVNGIAVGSYHGATLGLNTITVFDAAGNSVSRTFTLDNVIATPSLVTPANNAVVNGASLTQSWSTTDTDIDYYVYESYNNEAATSVRFTDTYETTSKTATNVANATFWWRVKAVDNAGNVSQWSELRKLTVDNTAPSVTINAIATNPTTISGTVTEPATVTITVDGADYQVVSTDGTWSIANPVSGQGTHDVSVVATDAAGNTTSPAVTATFLIDTVAPVTTLVSDVTFIGNNGTATLTATVDDASTFALTRNGAAIQGFNGSTYEFDTTGFTSGTYVFVLTASDATGNQAEEQTVTITVDNTAPAVAIDTATEQGNTPTVTGTAEAGTTLVVTFNGATTTILNNNGVWSFTSPTALENGTYAFSITATDAAGNATTSNSNVIVAVIPPATTQSFTVTPATINPAAAAVLGATTDNDAAAQSGAADVAGATDDKTAAAIDSEANNGTIFGLAWYWWLLILAALAALAWFIIAAIRRRNEEQA